VATVTTVFTGTKLTLVRHFDETKGESAEKHCGPLVDWSRWIAEIGAGLEYYKFGDTHKFFEKVVVHCYSLSVGLPDPNIGGAYCVDLGTGRSVIHIPYFNGGGYDPYVMDAYLSHELGHAFHNWTRCFADKFGKEFVPFWDRQISENNSTFDATKSPWKTPTGGIQYANEMFANAFRCYFGARLTRGVSGPGSKDPVTPGFRDPALNQGWCTQMKLLPETAAMIEAYGIKAGTLAWPWGDTGGWRFQLPSSGTPFPNLWVSHWFDNSNMAQWLFWNGSAWLCWYPTYNRT
jgi:hypothetical protein